MGTTADKINYLAETKECIRKAFESLGIYVPLSASFRSYADIISQLRPSTAPVLSRKAVNLYIGDRGYSYTAEEFLALNSYPPFIKLDGLLFQGWNYRLSNAQDYVNKYGMLDISANYITEARDTKLYVNLDSEDKLFVQLYCGSLNNNNNNNQLRNVIVDWGDGSQPASKKNPNHQYTTTGEYVITIRPQDGDKLQLGSGSYNILATTSTGVNPNDKFSDILTRVDIGDNVVSLEIRQNIFSNNIKLTQVFLPKSFHLYERIFDSCESLETITLSSDMTFGERAFINCTSLKYIALPEGITKLSEKIFSGCTSLESIAIPEGITKLNEEQFSGCTSLKNVILPEGLTQISAFTGCTSLESIMFPSTIRTVSGFKDCPNMQLYDFRRATSVPYVGYNTLSLSDGCQIVVPDNLYDEWVTTDYWKYISKSYFVKASEYTEV